MESINSTDRAEALLSFWFGEQLSGFADKAHSKRWWQGGASFDTQIRRLFGDLVTSQ